jgi:lantibiotic modifying enzyme
MKINNELPFFELVEKYIKAEITYPSSIKNYTNFIQEVSKRLIAISKYALYNEYSLQQYFFDNNLFKIEDSYEVCYNQLLSKSIVSYIPAPLLEIFKASFHNSSCYYLEIINNFNKDYPRLSAFFSLDINTTIEKIEFLGDPHKGGKSVSVITLSDNSKIIYRPFKTSNYTLLSDILENFNSHIALPKGIDIESHSWIEYIPDVNYEDIDNYSFSGGVLCAVSQVFGIDDLHYENIKFYQNKFYLLDIETAFCRLDSHEEKNITISGEITSINLTPLFTSLLPIWTTGLFGGSAEFSGLLGPAKNNYGELRYMNTGTNAMKLAISYTELKSKNAINSDKLIAGYNSTFILLQSLLEDKLFMSMLMKNDNITRRKTHRSTIEYFGIIELYLKQLSNTGNQVYLKEILNSRNRFSETITNQEFIQINNFDIPFFEEQIKSKDLIDDIQKRIRYINSNLNKMNQILAKSIESQFWTFEDIEKKLVNNEIYSL